MTKSRDISTPSRCEPDYETMKDLLVRMTMERSLPELLESIVSTIADCPDTALVRIWLTAPGDRCNDCAMREECPTGVDCLHLVASSGWSKQAGERAWTSLDGRFQRFPIGARNQGCGVISVGESSWAEIKARYR